MEQPLPMSLRTAESERYYQDQKLAGTLIPLADEPTIRAWTYWRIIENRFPYNVALAKHHLLLPIRAVPDRSDLKDEELAELVEIIALVASEYDFVMENFPKRRSILAHYHLHLGEYYPTRSDMKL